jgi:hypothetical protein
VSRLLWPDLGPDESEAGWLVDVPQVTSSQVLDALARRHPMDGINGMPGRWVFVREVQASTGAYSDIQRFDAVAVGLVPSVKYARIVYEVKVSRGDWLRELRPLVDVHDANGHRLSTHFGRRAELVSELRDDPAWRVTDRRKWDAALEVSTEFWVAAPPRCVQLAELPPEAGLVEVRAWGPDHELRAKVVRQAPARDTPMPDSGFWAAVLRRTAERRAAS